MSSFRDIALNVIDSDTLLGRSMYNSDDYERAMIEMKTDFFLRNGGKVYKAKMGESAEFNPLRPDSKRYEDKINKTTIKHQNLISVGNGKIGVKIGTFKFGKFDTIKEALMARDDYRVKNNMKPAEY